MHVMYTIDSRYLIPMLVSAYSLISNGGLKDIHFHIVTSGMSKEDQYLIEYFLGEFEGVTVDIYHLEDNPIDKYGVPEWRGTQISNARLFFPRIIKERHPEIKNLLYKDSDTFVRRSLEGLEAFNDFTVCAAKEDTAAKSHYKKELNLDAYCNSGIIYMNLDKLDYAALERDIKEVIKSNIPLTFPDQDIFNLIFQGSSELGILPTRYNLSLYPFIFSGLEFKLFYINRQLSHKEVLVEKENVIISHSIGMWGIKYWYNSKVNPLTPDFLDYARRIDPNYELMELPRMKKLLTSSPELFKLLLIAKACFLRNVPIGKLLHVK